MKFVLLFFICLNLDVCERGWCNSCDALIILGFVFSLLPIILVPTVPTIYTPLRGQVLSCCKKCEKLGDMTTNAVAVIIAVVLIV